MSSTPLSQTCNGNFEIEIDISDTELAEIMPRVSPSRQLLAPLPAPDGISSGYPSSGIITNAVLSESISKPVKKPRKPMVSKKAQPTTTTVDIVMPTNSNLSGCTEIVSEPSTATPSKTKSGAAAEQQFTLGLTKECFTAEELAINPLTHIFIENSRVTNNELIKYQAVRTGIIDYKCYGKGCPTKDGNWRRRLGFLILVRNNNRDTDLRMTNLSLMCPNCYCQEKGAMAFEKMKKEIVRTCTFCGTVLDTKYNSDKCGRCAWQIKNQIQKSANMDRLSRAFGTEVEGLSASNMALLMNSSILDEGTCGIAGGRDTHKYSGASVAVSSGRGMRMIPRQTVNPAELRIENSMALKRLFMELSEQV